MPLLKRCNRGLVALLALSLGLLASEARAASVSYFGTYPLTQYLNGGTRNFPAFSFPKFDVHGQCLTSVCVTVDGGLAGFISFENFQPTPATVNVTYTGTITLKRPDNSTILAVQPLTTTTDNVTAYDGGADYGGTSGKTYPNVNATEADSLCLSSNADLALFTGAGTIALPASALDQASQTGASGWSIGVQAYATVKLTYNYQDCTTPAEPKSWGRIKSNYR